MPMKIILTHAALVAGLAVSVPSMAVTVASANCLSVADAHGCLFTGLLDGSTVADTQAKYNLYNNTHYSAGNDLSLNYLFNSDSMGFPGTVSGLTTGNWSTPGYKVLFLAVNAGPSFVLYRLPAFVSSGTWSTADIPHGANLREVRSLVFLGTAVPEPMTWALMIAGFGMVGTAMRRQNSARSLLV